MAEEKKDWQKRLAGMLTPPEMEEVSGVPSFTEGVLAPYKKEQKINWAGKLGELMTGGPIKAMNMPTELLLQATPYNVGKIGREALSTSVKEVLSSPAAQEVAQGALSNIPGVSAIAGTGEEGEGPQPGAQPTGELQFFDPQEAAREITAATEGGLNALAQTQAELERYKGTMSELEAGITGSVEEQRAAIEAQAATQQEAAQTQIEAIADQQKFLIGQQSAIESYNAHREQVMGELDQELDAERKAFRAMEPDPNRLMRPFKNKMLAAIAFAFGQIGAAFTKQPNEIARQIEGIIDADIRQQEMKFRQKRYQISDLKDAYQHARSRFKDNTEALIVAKANYLDVAALELEKIRTRYGGLINQEQAEIVSAQLGMMESKERAKIAEMRVTNSVKMGALKLQEFKLKAAAATQKGALGSKAQSQIVGQAAGWGMVQRLKKKFYEMSISSPETIVAYRDAKRAEALQIIKQLIGQRVTQQEAEWQAKALPDYSDQFLYNPISGESVADAKWDLFTDFLKARMSTTKKAWLKMHEGKLDELDEMTERDWVADGFTQRRPE